jgi:hypothetical protein
MTTQPIRLFAVIATFAFVSTAYAHGCDPVDKYLIGHYHGQCDDATELPQGKGEAKGADTYVGEFMQGKPDGKGVYTWENGARLTGSFKDGKAHGAGTFVSAQGVRYQGDFSDGRLMAIRKADCPKTRGPLSC